MADLEAVLADVSYLMAMEKSRSQPAARASKRIVLPDPSVRSIMQKYLEKTGEIKFEKIFNQKLGFLLLKDFAENVTENACPQIKFYEAIKEYEKMETPEERLTKAREIYDHHIMVEMLAHAHNYSKDSLQHVQYHLLKGSVPPDLFQLEPIDVVKRVARKLLPYSSQEKATTLLCNVRPQNVRTRALAVSDHLCRLGELARSIVETPLGSVEEPVTPVMTVAVRYPTGKAARNAQNDQSGVYSDKIERVAIWLYEKVDVIEMMMSLARIQISSVSMLRHVLTSAYTYKLFKGSTHGNFRVRDFDRSGYLAIIPTILRKLHRRRCQLSQEMRGYT
ncbi:hypothetical protein Y032_0001g398 [Ancylostoma ceylanicum]|nr:hypothetical protein Y032_0001g398 [Ancylostoma ceylanicum]